MNTVSAVRPKPLSLLLEGFAEVAPAQDRTIEGLSLDSRHAARGDLFFACAGSRGHGLEYLEQALDAGVVAVAWEPSDDWHEVPQPQRRHADIPMYAIRDLHKLIGFVADRFYEQPSADLFVIGITGTDGKTSCSHFIANAIHQGGEACGVLGTLGYGLYGALEVASHTTPDAIRLHRLLHSLRSQGVRYVVMEVSSHGLEQGRVAGIRYDVAVLTNLTRDHLDYHGSEAAYAEAKRKLFHMPGLRHAVINLDDAFGRSLLAHLDPSVHVVTYQAEAGEGPGQYDYLAARAARFRADGFSFQAHGSWGECNVDSGLLGAFNIANLLAALGVLMTLPLDWSEACARVSAAQAVPGRMQNLTPAGYQHAPAIVLDYAHTPNALQQVLSSLRRHTTGELWCVFGCGGNRDAGKRPLMGAVAEQHADHVVLTDDNPRHEDGGRIVHDIQSGLRRADAVHVQRDRKKAIEYALQHARAGDVVLIAGKGHETCQIVGDRVLPFSDREVVQQWLARTAS